MSEYPQRIVCLTEETTETLYLLGEDWRIVGVSGYTVRPPEARKKPRVSAFTTARFDAIMELQPDLVLTFSDLQADITAELVRRGLNVFNFNQRSLEEILAMMATLARLVGAHERGAALLAAMRSGLDAVAASAARFRFRPRVLFEEWKDPLITGIRWVEELVSLAGGDPVFPELGHEPCARQRIVAPAAVVARDPEVIIASWCGQKVNKRALAARPGWDAIAAVRAGHIYEIKSTYILQPGPAALTEGVRQLHAILAHVADAQPDPALAPEQRVDPDLLRGRAPQVGAP
ncbi:MAG TPA: cobalamin-binding protein [Terriglobales bacterium]|nr:cobalamin-binding protein [Terriglobales bacterium]